MKRYSDELVKKLGEEKRNILKELGDSAKFMVTGK